MGQDQKPVGGNTRRNFWNNLVNPCRTEFMLENIEMYLYVLLVGHTDMVYVLESFPREDTAPSILRSQYHGSWWPGSPFSYMDYNFNLSMHK